MNTVQAVNIVPTKHQVRFSTGHKKKSRFQMHGIFLPKFKKIETAKHHCQNFMICDLLKAQPWAIQKHPQKWLSKNWFSSFSSSCDFERK